MDPPSKDLKRPLLNSYVPDDFKTIVVIIIVVYTSVVALITWMVLQPPSAPAAASPPPAPALFTVPGPPLTWKQVCDMSNITTKAQAAQHALTTPILSQLVAGGGGALDAAVSKSLNEVFDSWAEDFKLSFDTPDQRAAAVKNFHHNLLDMFKTNTDPSLGHWAGCNQYTSMTFAEFSKSVLMRETSSDTLEETRLDVAVGGKTLSYPPTVDWVAAGRVTAARNQRRCGSCWAFAAVAAVESLYLMTNPTNNPNLDATNLDLSEEQIIECVSSVTVNPSVRAPRVGMPFKSSLCTGGWAEEVFDYLTGYGINNEDAAQAYLPTTCGMGTLNKSYPLNCRTNGTQCPSYLSAAGKSLKIPEFRGKVSPPSNEEALKKAVAIRPVTTFFQVGPGFMRYAGGIYTPPTADCNVNPPFFLNHLMLIVGYDDINNWWLIKNSWGKGWGINSGITKGPISGQGGFAKVIMNGQKGGACGLAVQNYWPNPEGAFPTNWDTVDLIP